ncbi:hypothetical protein [Pseudomonas sp. 18058]|uniref:hypothetical protein n=1 Tax=Pseudomonas sp. 18058 TaxID=2681406 RepID=UPI003531E38A
MQDFQLGGFYDELDVSAQRQHVLVLHHAHADAMPATVDAEPMGIDSCISD